MEVSEQERLPLTSLPLLLLPLLRDSRGRSLHFVERGGGPLRVAYDVTCCVLGLPQSPCRSVLIRRPSATGGSFGRIINQILTFDERSASPSPRTRSRISSACRQGETRDAISTAPTLATIIDLLAGDYRSASLARMCAVRDLFLRPTGPFRRAVEVTEADCCDQVLNELRHCRPLLRLDRLLRLGLRRIAVTEPELRERLGRARPNEAAIGEGFADFVAAAINDTALLEAEALLIALEGSTFESTFAVDGIFVDDCVGIGETYVTLSTLTRLYRQERPVLYAPSSPLVGAIKRWGVPIHIASDRGPVIENLPWLSDAVWEWHRGWYVRRPFASYGVASFDDSEFLAQLVLAVPPPERAAAKAMLVRIAERSRLGFVEALEAELDATVVTPIPDVPTAVVGGAAFVVKREACARWSARHHQFRSQMEACARQMALASPPY
jgi:hypothetical protein